MIGPYFAQLSEEFPSIVFLKVDVDKNGVSVGRSASAYRTCSAQGAHVC